MAEEERPATALGTSLAPRNGAVLMLITIESFLLERIGVDTVCDLTAKRALWIRKVLPRCSVYDCHEYPIFSVFRVSSPRRMSSRRLVLFRNG